MLTGFVFAWIDEERFFELDIVVMWMGAFFGVGDQE
jgi:hypothetical protein